MHLKVVFFDKVGIFNLTRRTAGRHLERLGILLQALYATVNRLQI
jgi:hypothetical protein